MPKVSGADIFKIFIIAGAFFKQFFRAIAYLKRINTVMAKI